MLNNAVILTGLVIGAIAVLSACFGWLRVKNFGTTPGVVLCLIGALLIGLSFWGRVSFKMAGVEAEFERLAQQVERTSEGVVELAQRLEVSQRSFVQLAEVIEAPGEPADQRIREITDPVRFMADREPEVVRDLALSRERDWGVLTGESAAAAAEQIDEAAAAEMWSAEMEEMEAEMAEEAAEEPP